MAQEVRPHFRMRSWSQQNCSRESGHGWVGPPTTETEPPDYTIPLHTALEFGSKPLHRSTRKRTLVVRTRAIGSGRLRVRGWRLLGFLGCRSQELFQLPLLRGRHFDFPQWSHSHPALQMVVYFPSRSSMFRAYSRFHYSHRLPFYVSRVYENRFLHIFCCCAHPT